MKFNFNELGLGAKISLIAIGVGFISLFIPYRVFQFMYLPS